MSTAAEAERFVNRFAVAWRKPEPEAFGDFWHEDATLLHPTMDQPLNAEGIPQHVASIKEAVPDVSLRVRDWAWRPQALFIEWELTGTAGDRRLIVPGVDRFTLRGERAVAGVAYYDTAAWR